MRSSRSWEYELKKFIALYVYWQLSEASFGPFVTKEGCAQMLICRGLLAVEGRIILLRKRIASCMGNDTFILSGK